MGGAPVFAISDEPVTFHVFGTLFMRDGWKLPQALYFDGNISRLYAPGLGRRDGGFPMGPIVGRGALRCAIDRRPGGYAAALHRTWGDEHGTQTQGARHFRLAGRRQTRGMTSTAVVNKVRWALQAKKAGHAGTLDPEATGVLAVALGEATKTVPYITDALKVIPSLSGSGRPRTPTMPRAR